MRGDKNRNSYQELLFGDGRFDDYTEYTMRFETYTERYMDKRGSKVYDINHARLSSTKLKNRTREETPYPFRVYSESEYNAIVEEKGYFKGYVEGYGYVERGQKSFPVVDGLSPDVAKSMSKLNFGNGASGEGMDMAAEEAKTKWLMYSSMCRSISQRTAKAAEVTNRMNNIAKGWRLPPAGKSPVFFGVDPINIFKQPITTQSYGVNVWMKNSWITNIHPVAKAVGRFSGIAGLGFAIWDVQANGLNLINGSDFVLGTVLLTGLGGAPAAITIGLFYVADLFWGLAYDKRLMKSAEENLEEAYSSASNYISEW